MSEAKTSSPTTARFMREAAHPSWPEALDLAARRFIAAGPGALREYREAALSALRRHGLPQAGSEDFTFVRLSDFGGLLASIPEAAKDGNSTRTPGWQAAKTATMPTLDLVRSYIFPESKDNFLVILDGEYSPALSKVAPGIRIDALEAAAIRPAEAQAAHPRPATSTDAASSSAAFVATAFTAPLKANLVAALARETDAASSLAALFASQPLLVQVDPQAAPPAPLQVLHLRTSETGPRRDTFLVIAAGRLSESRFLVRHAEAPIGNPATASAGSLSNVHVLALLDEGASVKWLESAPEGVGNAEDLHFHKLGALLERDSRLWILNASTGSRLTRNAYAVDLRGQGAEAEIHGATVLAGTRQSHQFVQLRHLAPHCNSRQHFKTVAADRSRASVDGTIFVSEGAQLTNAEQLINNLMLSDEARADSKPRLLIHADDVKCAHGATSGKLDEDQQFYLESRGLPAEQARTLLTLAFIAEVVERADQALGGSTGFRAHLDATLMDTLKRRLGGEGA